MAFNSLPYLAFYLCVLAVSWSLVGLPRLRIIFVLLASYYFYASNNRWLLLLLVGSTQVDFVAAKLIEDTTSKQRKKLLLTVSVIINLSILGFFKYFNFFAGNVAALFSALGLHASWVDLHIFLPVGISFYTFESMSYVMDVYRGDLKAVRSWYRYSFFVAYFPHLIAGPIVRPHDFLPQIDRRPRLSRADLESALLLIFRGMFKKIVIADYLATYANDAFSHPERSSGPFALLAAYCFSFQIYFDFSGYSDIAIGCSRLEGFWLPDNFRRPYSSATITEFWQRWHISLSNWLRDYLYISLGGNRMRSKFGVYRNLMITMLLGGLWHGAAWHFVMWGGLQGLLLVVERFFGIGGAGKPKQHAAATMEPVQRRVKWLPIFITFQLVTLSWILFRAENNHQLWAFFASLGRFGQPFVYTQGMVVAGLMCMIGWLTQIYAETLELRFSRLPVVVKASVYAAIAAMVGIFSNASSKFIYFEF
jgi:alginate O-acetyltransferase complex protein AlgI